jgi:hypothetical protein
VGIDVSAEFMSMSYVPNKKLGRTFCEHLQIKLQIKVQSKIVP